MMAYFHYRCGERITLTNDSCTAIRDDTDFDHGLVLSAEHLVNDVLFEIKIDRKVNSWSGSLEIGVVDCDPLHFDFPPCASKIQAGSWIMSSSSFFKNGNCMIEGYGMDLDKLNQEDRVGLMRTSEGDLIFYINGESQGVAAEGLPNSIYAVVDLYGKCVQVSITSPALREHNNDDCLSGSSVLAIDNDILNVTLGGDLSELSFSSSNSLDIRMDLNVSLSLPEEIPRQDRLRFHDRCGSLVKLSNGSRSAERRRPLDEFNNGVVMTFRPLKDNELFEIRIDRLVDKWSGSIEMGITTHNPNTLVFPATMTNLRSGTIMMSGCGILTNGKGTRREYGEFNLDELSEGDRVGMMRKPDGNLHYFINGLDQGVAAQRVPSTVWGVIDLYGMTIKVSIVERDEREEQNLMTRKNTRIQQIQPIVQEVDDDDLHPPLPDYYNRLTFHQNCGTHALVINNGRTAHRPNAADDFNNGVVLTARPLKIGELFEIRLDRVVSKWAGSIEIGVTTHSPVDLEFPFTMTNVRSGTWMMTGSGIMHNGTIVLEQYGVNLDRLQVGDRVGVLLKDNGLLHFFVNGIDQGTAASNVPTRVFGVIDLYGQAAEASIIDMYDCGSPDTINSSLSNTTLYSDLRFHHIHGKNARIINNGLTALRPRPLAEFNDAIVFSCRPLRDNELFEVCLDGIVNRWSGSIELGVTAVRPDDIDLPTTATDLSRNTWMLSGSSVMENGKTTKNNYPCDLDTLHAGIRLGVMRSSTTKILEFYRDGVPQGAACIVPHPIIYAVVDLYGQCAQVSIASSSLLSGGDGTVPLVLLPSAERGDPSSLLLQGIISPTNTISNNIVPVVPLQVPLPSLVASTVDLHRFQLLNGTNNNNVILSECGRLAKRNTNNNNNCIKEDCFVYSGTPLVPDELFEISIVSLMPHLAGSISIGIVAATTLPLKINTNCYFLTSNELKYDNKTVQLFTPSFDWLNVRDRVGLLKQHDGTIKILINDEEIIEGLNFPPHTTTEQQTDNDNDDNNNTSLLYYVVVELRGSCAAVAVTSHKTTVLTNLSPTSTNTTTSTNIIQRLQDSLELMAPITTRKNLNDDQKTTKIHYEFDNENRGRNIELIEDRTVAQRVASFNHGIVIIHPALSSSSSSIMIKIVIEQIDMIWQSSLIVGLICGPVLMDRLISLPVNALALKGPSCIIADDWISMNGMKSQSNYGRCLRNLRVGDRVGVMYCPDTRQLTLFVNDVIVNGDDGALQCVFPHGQPVYAVFDLYGQCQQIRILNDVIPIQEKNDNDEKSSSDLLLSSSSSLPIIVDDCEKAVLEECCEKETETNSNNNNKLALPIPSTSNTGGASNNNNNNNTTANLSIIVSPTTTTSPLLKVSAISSCSYKKECEAFKKKLLLPDHYFTNDIPITCYCTSCYKINSSSSDKVSMNGWVKFPLRNLANISMDKWHTAFYSTKIGAVRCILDKGQPLTKGQAQWCNLVAQKNDDVQVVFYPSLDNCMMINDGFKIGNNQICHAAFQLYVKPSAYSIMSHDPPEWSTKETGAIVLSALLIQLCPRQVSNNK